MEVLAFVTKVPAVVVLHVFEPLDAAVKVNVWVLFVSVSVWQNARPIGSFRICGAGALTT